MKKCEDNQKMSASEMLITTIDDIFKSIESLNEFDFGLLHENLNFICENSQDTRMGIYFADSLIELEKTHKQSAALITLMIDYARLQKVEKQAIALFDEMEDHVRKAIKKSKKKPH